MALLAAGCVFGWEDGLGWKQLALSYLKGSAHPKAATSVAAPPLQRGLHPIPVLQPLSLCLPSAPLQWEYLFIPASLLSSLFSPAYLWLLPFSSRPPQPELGHYAQLVVEAINLRGQRAA